MRYSATLTLVLVLPLAMTLAGCGGGDERGGQAKAPDSTVFVPPPQGGGNDDRPDGAGGGGVEPGMENMDPGQQGGQDRPDGVGGGGGVEPGMENMDPGQQGGQDRPDGVGGGGGVEPGMENMDPGQQGGQDRPDGAGGGGMEPGMENMDPGQDTGMQGMEGMEGGGGGRASRRGPLPKGMEGLAQLAFEAGRDREAFQYLYAMSLTDDPVGVQALQSYKWAPALRRPVMAIRWAVGVHIDGPTTMGEKSKRPTTWQFPGAMAEGVFSLSYLKGRVARSYYGEVLKKAAFPDGLIPTANEPSRVARGGGGGMEAGMENMDPGMEGGADGGLEGAGGGGGGGAAQASARSFSLTGVAMLGEGRADELVEKAASQGIHALIVFDVVTKILGREKSRKLSRSVLAELYDVESKTKIASTRRLNIPTQLAMRDASIVEKLKKEVETELTALFAKADENYQMVDLPPQVNAQNVLGRVSTLAGEQPANPLPALSEIKFYQSRGLLPDNELTAAFHKILGDERGEQLVSGDAETKKKVAESLVTTAKGDGRTLPELPPLR